MPSLTTANPNLQVEGPLIDVHFLISTELEKKYREEGKPVPEPIVVKALIDTGASHSVIQEEIAKTLGLRPVGAIKINTPSSKDHECYQYFIKMLLPKHNLAYEGTFTATPLEGQNIQCLIGRDVLAHGTLIYIGYINQFTFSLF